MTTIREQLIDADFNIIDSASIIKKTKRTVPQYEDMKRYASTQFPFVAITAGLPKAINYHESRRGPGMIDQVQSELEVEANVYFYQANNELVDTYISSMSNTLFALLFQNQTRDNLCQMTTVALEPKIGYWKPHGAFKILITHTYIHSIGGI